MRKSNTLHYCYFKIHIICLLFVVFFIEFLQIDFSFASEESTKCLELKDPKNLEDLIKLRLCIRKINKVKEFEKESKIIQYAFEGSKNLTEKITLAKKNTKIISE